MRPQAPGGNRVTTAIHFRASETDEAEQALARLTRLYQSVPVETAEVIVALGGDGFMLQTLNATRALERPVYGMNCGTIGFLMNEYGEDDLPGRLARAVEEVINPLRMRAHAADGTVTEALAINEVSLLRAGPPSGPAAGAARCCRKPPGCGSTC